MSLTEHPFYDRLMAKVDTSGDCWLWTGHIDTNGYGRFYAGNPEDRWAHRNVWVMANGPIPDGMEIDHLCRVRHCVNPEHLEVVTHDENLRRAIPFRLHPCGTEAAYLRGCRCEPCTAAGRAVRQARNEAAVAEGRVTHGLNSTYKRGCRCDECRKASSAETLRYRRAKGVKPRPEAKHGGHQRYARLGCRCEVCKQGNRDRQKAWRDAKARHDQPAYLAAGDAS